MFYYGKTTCQGGQLSRRMSWYWPCDVLVRTGRNQKITWRQYIKWRERLTFRYTV